MKKIGLIFMLLLLSQTAVAAQNTGFYFGVSGGYVIPQTMEYSDPGYYHAYSFDTTLENGYFLSIKTGWNTPFTRRIMAMEVEYNYINNNFDNNKVLLSSTTYDGNMSIHAILFNLKARYPDGPIHPYAGFGLGWAYSSVGDITERDLSGSIVTIWPGESGGGVGWQFLAGVDFDIAPNMSFGVGYKFFASNTTIGTEHGDDYDLDYRASIITLGLTFTF
jgi:opacity protein-like surface antigen